MRWNGRAYEAACSLLQRRVAQDLYHSAIRVSLPTDTWIIEMTPVWVAGTDRGVIAEGAVGTRWAGRSRLFRYEVHCWHGGSIADLDEAVESPRRLTSDDDLCRRLLDGVASVPTPVWGRDELETGEMWNSNSVTSWVLARSGIDVAAVRPPADGRAPGWDAGVIAERRAWTISAPAAGPGEVGGQAGGGSAGEGEQGRLVTKPPLGP
ncbi:hypothetical protein acdb102_24270 [Acidothermaceae bacterium B102]|nr:hypothetical protein acdb102_24270 [Acidothermaceae bacterium B102]